MLDAETFQLLSYCTVIHQLSLVFFLSGEVNFMLERQACLGPISATLAEGAVVKPKESFSPDSGGIPDVIYCSPECLQTVAGLCQKIRSWSPCSNTNSPSVIPTCFNILSSFVSKEEIYKNCGISTIQLRTLRAWAFFVLVSSFIKFKSRNGLSHVQYVGIQAFMYGRNKKEFV